jgi:putative phage-type endonuclease
MNPKQGTDEWKLQRVGLATASRFNDIMAKTRSGYAASRKNYMADLLVERLTQKPKDSYTNEAMSFGTDNEPVARLAYELETGNTVVEAFFERHKTLQAGASPDGYVNDDGLVEIKVPNLATHLDTLRNQEVPTQYIAQVQGQLWITGREWCDFVSYTPYLENDAQLFIKRVPRDRKFIRELEAEVKRFLIELNKEVQFVLDYRR